MPITIARITAFCYSYGAYVVLLNAFCVNVFRQPFYPLSHYNVETMLEHLHRAKSLRHYCHLAAVGKKRRGCWLFLLIPLPRHIVWTGRVWMPIRRWIEGMYINHCWLMEVAPVYLLTRLTHPDNSPRHPMS